jgi:signal transduction histidine kinase
MVSNVVDDFKSQLIGDKINKIINNGGGGLNGNINNNIRLLLISNKQSLIVEADKGRITQVISNLVSNAIKFTREGGGGDIIVKIEQEAEGHEVIVSVKDSGPGISSNIFPRLFSKFASESLEGTGLGLFISKSIIKAHGGKIWAYNKNAKNNKNDGANISSGNENDDDSRITKEKGAIFAFSLPSKYIELQQ